ncbi:hypothetical protein [Aquimarina pacifica]|uniref:hypothetical protein n=1 Tax=Aquimarina pacifica TaxID=1296415 RepID=UPI0004B78368|nr:hypothetical protein [Aquimarina pacifica]
MKITLQQIKALKYVDRLIRMRLTGPPDQLAKKLKISKKSLFLLIEFMKQQQAVIVYDITLQSYVYDECPDYTFSIVPNNSDQKTNQTCLTQYAYKHPRLRIV